MSQRALALAVVLLMVGAAQAAAAPLRPLVASTRWFLTDRERYALWGDPETAAPVVFDTRTGRQSRPQVPAGCGILGAFDSAESARQGRARLDCLDGHKIDLDLRTGATVPAGHGEAGPPFNAGACRLTREAREADPLDLSPLWSGPYLLATNLDRTRLELRRCGHAPRLLARGRVNSPRIGGGFVSWQTGPDGWHDWESDDARSRPTDRLWIYRTRTGERRSWRLPNVPFSFDVFAFDHIGVSWHTRDAAFWAALVDFECDKLCSPDRWRVFWAPIT